MTDSQKTVVITGGAAGIGLAMVKAFLKSDVQVTGVSMNTVDGHTGTLAP